jgi:hypothetical protein
MPQQAGIAVENNFSRGLFTEATGLNYPENSCTETYNCVFETDGSVRRRLGIDYELAATTKNIDRDNSVINTYLWRNVAGDGNVTLFVVQVGATIYFYEATGSSLSGGALSTTVSLTGVSGAPSDISNVEAQFCDGNGVLIITHPYCDPLKVTYNTSTDTASSSTITLQIRDFEGDTADVLAVDGRPTATDAGLTAAHKYNLLNQGWTQANLTAWDTAQTTMPSNADIQWHFKDANNAFDFSSASIAKITTGNTQAPRGHFISNPFNFDRDAAAGTSGATDTTASYNRPSTCAFYAGRVFYAGVNYTGFNSNIYFSKIIENSTDYGKCHQVNDPTSEELYDLLPTDGGVIKIPEAGTVYKLFAVPGGLCAFASNGVWYITGSTGLGFTANDYTVQKIAKISTISASSFVDVMGYPMWWNLEGIYALSVADGSSFPTVNSLTFSTIKDFYDEIPLNSKKTAKGFFNYVDGIAQWVYRNEDTDSITDIYAYDRVLNFNVATRAFYPWTVSTGAFPAIHGIVVFDAVVGQTSVDQVIDGSGNTVIDADGNNVITFTVSGVSPSSLTTKFLVSSPTGSTYAFTFAEENNTDYLDWYQFDVTGTSFDSYFVTGYKLRGEGMRNFQPNWVNIFSRTTENVSFKFRGIWGYSNTSGVKWSSQQIVSHTDNTYTFTRRRLRVRGLGPVLQFRVDSVDGSPFNIIGWSVLDAVNQLP